MLAVMLLLPRLNLILGEWTYGRWMPVHMNLQLYGWMSLPLVAFLFHVYGVDRGAAAKWCRPMLWVWSAALAAGALTWLAGRSSGKLFLDWTGYSRVLFPLALVALWLVLALALASDWRRSANKAFTARSTKLIGLALLLLVPVLIYIAASPNLYPPINPDSGGPTAASQLESTLVVIAILLLLPFGLTQRKAGLSRTMTLAWIIFCGRVRALHWHGAREREPSPANAVHQPGQFAGLATADAGLLRRICMAQQHPPLAHRIHVVVGCAVADRLVHVFAGSAGPLQIY
jgi:cytochrome c oxidase cbb3-type subunit 1